MKLSEKRIIVEDGHSRKIINRIGSGYRKEIRRMIEEGMIIDNKKGKTGKKLCIAKGPKKRWYKIPFTPFKDFIIIISVIPITKKEAKRLKRFSNNRNQEVD